MKINGLTYEFAVTIANDFDHLSLECYCETGLVLEAELVSYKDRQAVIHTHQQTIPFEVLEEFTRRVSRELDSIKSRQKHRFVFSNKISNVY